MWSSVDHVRDLTSPGKRLIVEQRFHKCLPRHAQMFSDVIEDGTEGADPQRTVTRNRDVMLTPLRRCQAQVAACLACCFVAILPEQARQFLPADVPG